MNEFFFLLQKVVDMVVEAPEAVDTEEAVVEWAVSDPKGLLAG